MYIVYCHTNRNTNKRYIGYTKKSLEKRWLGHVKDVRNGSNYRFHRSIRKHGLDVWDHDVICEDILTLSDAKVLEQHFIEMLGTYENGYNMTMGGEGGTLSFDERIKRSQKMTGQKKSKTTRDKMRAYALSRPKEHNEKTAIGFKRWLVSHPEHYEIISKVHRKSVEQCTLDGQTVATYVSVSDAAKQTGSNASLIAAVARGCRVQHRGFKWRYI